MKAWYFTLLIAIICVSCEKEVIADYAVIKGAISNSKSDTIVLRSVLTPFSKKLGIDRDGQFLDTLKVDKNEHYTLYDDGHLLYIYMGPGDIVNLNYDHGNFKNSIQFTGTNAPINNYIVEKNRKESEIIGKGNNSYELNETDFKQIQTEIKNAQLTLLSDTKHLPVSYTDRESKNIQYKYVSNMSNYPAYHARYTKVTDFEVSDNFLVEAEKIDYNNYEDYMFSYSFRNLLRQYHAEEAEKIAKTDSISYDVAYLKAINAMNNQKIKNDLLYNNAKYGISYTSDLEKYYKEFMSGSTDDAHKGEMTESYQVLKTVAKGQPSPKFIDFENNDGSTTSLDDLKGKFVYIDIWATWCGPCKAEIPYLKEIEVKYHDKNIEFVSVSIDRKKDYEKWKQMINDEELGGIQLLADNDFESQFVQDYFVKGIPRFILLDPDGVIISSNAPRPSSDKLIELFEASNI